MFTGKETPAMTRKMFFGIALLGFAQVCDAHECWIEPQTHRIKPGEVVRVALKLGERFLGETTLRDESLIDKFVSIGPDGEQPVVGRSGASSSFARFKTPGLHCIAYRSRRRFNEMNPRQFEAYLQEEGLDHVLAQRAALGESDRPGREVFSRCAKALILAGKTADGGHDRIAGLPLEIVPEANPFSLEPGAKLTLRILFQGAPLQDAKVVFVRKDEPQNLRSARTDGDGRVELEAPDHGIWMATTIHMIRAPVGVDADWESLWASLTFEIPRGDSRAAEH